MKTQLFADCSAAVAVVWCGGGERCYMDFQLEQFLNGVAVSCLVIQALHKMNERPRKF